MQQLLAPAGWRDGQLGQGGRREGDGGIRRPVTQPPLFISPEQREGVSTRAGRCALW